MSEVLEDAGKLGAGSGASNRLRGFVYDLPGQAGGVIQSGGAPQSAPVNRTDARLCSGPPEQWENPTSDSGVAVGGALTAPRRLAEVQC